jgi:hypothetical protein
VQPISIGWTELSIISGEYLGTSYETLKWWMDKGPYLKTPWIESSMAWFSLAQKTDYRHEEDLGSESSSLACPWQHSLVSYVSSPLNCDF